MPRPLVAVVGGFRDLNEADVEQAKLVATAIGAELAKAGFNLVVYSSDPTFLDPYVVSGYVAALPPGGGGLIYVRYSQLQRGEVKFPEEEKNADLFLHDPFPGDDWETPFYKSLADEDGVDAVLLMAGGKSTLIAGQIALARRVPVLLVHSFAGASAGIWRQLALGADNQGVYWNAGKPSESAKQLTDRCSERTRLRDEATKREKAYRDIINRDRNAVFAGIAFVIFMGLVWYGMAPIATRGHYAFLMLAGAAAAGATGSLLRGVIGATTDTNALASCVLGLVAGLVVGAAYLVPQWVSNMAMLEGFLDSGAVPVDALSENGTSSSASLTTADTALAQSESAREKNLVSSGPVKGEDKIQFIAASIVALTAGIGCDAVFARLRKEARELPVSLRKPE
jgi:hypothetical protein